MDRFRRRGGALAGLAVVAGVAAACGPAPVSPLPGQSARTPVTAPAAPPTSTAPTPGDSPACLGRVVHPVDASGSGPIPDALCLAAGAVLRLQNVGPGTVSADPPGKVSLRYEAGVIDCRLLAPGTVTVRIAGDGQTYVITVLVVA